MEKFTKRLYDLINESDCDQKDLAEKTGITAATISRYLNKKTLPSGRNLELLAEVFNVSVDYLLGRSDIRNYNSNDTFAAHTISGEDLTDEGKEKLQEYYELLKSKYSKK